MLFFFNRHHCSRQNNEKLIVFKQEVPLFTQIGGFIEENSLSWLNLGFPTEMQQYEVHNSHADSSEKCSNLKALMFPQW